MHLPENRFEELVIKALEAVPERFREKLKNIDIIIEENPTAEQLRHHEVHEGDALFGLYEGIPQIDRDDGYNFVLPDKITIFRQALLEHNSTEEELIKEIAATVRHEIAHHFGISDERLDALGKY